uniref:Zinc finger and BTB domain containing 39 n=1 Tax=Latimeria chalumnae TaxID=7897 RepID=H3BHJ5_LATCH
MGMRIKLHSAEHPNNLLKELNKCRLSETMCDVTIVVGNQSFAAHRAVLACAADYFQNLFMSTGPDVARTYVVDFLTPSNFEKILNFIYTSELFTDLINVGVIYEVAEKLGMSALLKACYSTFPDLESTAAAKHSSDSGASALNTFGTSKEQNHCIREARVSATQFSCDRNYILQVEVAGNCKQQETCPPNETNQGMPIMYPQPAKTEDQDSLMNYGQSKPSPAMAAQQTIGNANSSVQISTTSCHAYKIGSNGHYNQTGFFMAETALDDTTGSNSCPSNSESSKDQVFGQVDELHLEELGEEDLHFEDPGEDMGPAEEIIELSDDSEDDIVFTSENGSSGNQAMPCQVCKKVLEPNIQIIRQHARLHMDPQTGNCKVCNTQFQDRSSRVTHVLSHVGILLFSCDLCDTKFFTQWQLTYHRRNKICEANVIVQPSDILPEEVSSANGGPSTEFLCVACGKTLAKDFQAVKEHVFQHLHMKCLKCGVCDQPHRILCGLMWHVLAHMGISIFSCSVCASSFVDKDLLQKHLATHQGADCLLRCQFCSQRFRSELVYQHHLTQHKCAELAGMQNASDHPQRQRLLKRSLAEEPVGEEGLLPTQPGNSKWYVCKVCGKRFAHSSEFNYHVRIHTGEKPYQCKVCLKFFRGRSTIKCHLKTHAGALMYRCTVCGHYSPTLSIMTKHVEIHKGNLPPDFTIEQTFMYIIHSRESEKNTDS